MVLDESKYMAKNLAEGIESLFAIYRNAIMDQDLFDKVCLDVAAFLGQCKVDSNESGWKATTGFKVTSKDNYSVKLPPDNPAAILYYFALQIQAICNAGEMLANVSLPKKAVAWVEKHEKWLTTDDGKEWAKKQAEKREKEEKEKAEKAKKQEEALAKVKK